MPINNRPAAPDGNVFHSNVTCGERLQDAQAHERDSELPPVDLKSIFNVDEDTARDAEDILRPFDELIPIIVEGNEIKLPNNNSLWRGMQFWGLMTGEISIDFGLYCIAGTCKNCKTRIRRAGEDRKVNVLACQTTVEPGLEITRLAPGFKFIKKDY